MYDVDDSGCINLQEMTNIITTMDQLEGEEDLANQVTVLTHRETQWCWGQEAQ